MSFTGKMTGKPRISERAWPLMCRLQTFTRRDIATQLQVTTQAITALTKRLQQQGAIQLLDRQEGCRGNRYRVCIDEVTGFQNRGRTRGKRAPSNIKRSTHRQQIWNTIRIHRHVGPEVILTTTTASRDTVTYYLGRLTRAGYLKPLNSKKGSPPGTSLSYRLVRDTGRQYPTVSDGGMWDQNTQTFYPFVADDQQPAEAQAKESGHE